MSQFTPSDIKAVMDGTAPRRTVMAVLTSQTCGEACWHAREEVCRCECGGRNHGCLRTADGVRPTRSAKIGGISYELKAVGYGGTHQREAERLNHWTTVGWRGLSPVMQDGKCVQLYRYTWSETDDGAPARLKPASRDQLAKWEELRGFTDGHRLIFHGVRLLWVRRDYAAVAEAAAAQHEKHLSADNPWRDAYEELCRERREREAGIIGEIETLNALETITT
jgi:hypothetical protein